MPSPHVRSLDDFAVAILTCFSITNCFGARVVFYWWLSSLCITSWLQCVSCFCWFAVSFHSCNRANFTHICTANERTAAWVDRPFLFAAPPRSAGTEIRLGWSMLQARGGLGGLDRFFPRSLGIRFSWLRHLRWEQCGHGRTCRPKESSNPKYVSELSQRSSVLRRFLEHFRICWVNRKGQFRSPSLVSKRPDSTYATDGCRYSCHSWFEQVLFARGCKSFWS